MKIVTHFAGAHRGWFADITDDQGKIIEFTDFHSSERMAIATAKLWIKNNSEENVTSIHKEKTK
jgi:hypothetical protein